MRSQRASSPRCRWFVKWIVPLARAFVGTCRQEFDVHAKNAWRPLSSQIRCRGRSKHMSSFREAHLCLFESKVVPENASDVVRTFHAQAVGRMLSGLGRRMECDGPVIRIPHTKIGDPVRNARHLRGRHGGGISIEVHVRNLDRTARVGKGGSQHCEDCTQLPGGPPADWPALFRAVRSLQAANFSIHSIPPELMTREVYVEEIENTVVYRQSTARISRSGSDSMKDVRLEKNFAPPCIQTRPCRVDPSAARSC